MSAQLLEEGHAQLLEVQNLIHELELDRAQAMLDKIKRISVPDRRFKEHLRSKILFYRNDYDKTISLIEKTIHKHGPHVSLLSDRACAFYLKNDFFNFEAAVSKLELEYQSCLEDLDIDSLVNTGVCLGKFLEELGHVEKALRLYESLMLECEFYTHKTPIVLSQLLRLKSQWKIQKEIEIDYKRLFTLNAQLKSKNFNFELQHSLFLAELELFGPKVAVERFNEIKEHLSAEDLNLFVGDYIESALRNKFSIDENISSLLNKGLNPYEEQLLKILNRENIIFSKMSTTMPLGHVLRLMGLVLTSDSCPDGLEGQYTFLLQTVSGKDKAIWQNLIKDAQKIEMKIIDLDLSQKKMAFNGHVYDFARKGNAMSILQALSVNEKLSLESAVSTIYGASLDESYFHRLRMAIKRLNSDVAKTLHIDGLVKITNDFIEIQSGIELKK